MSPGNQPAVVVACLCAGWCSTCQTYRPTFERVAQGRPDTGFAWIDIEDDSDALGEQVLDILNFPTLMLLREGQVLFHGTVLPHAATLTRMLDALAAGKPLGRGDAAAVGAALAAAVWQLAPQRRVGG